MLFRSVNKDGSFVYSNLVADALDNITGSINISPNPAKDFINISGLNPVKNYELKVINKEGIQQSSFKISSSTNYKINISSLKNGIYFLKIKDGDGIVISLKFVKE